MNPAERSSTADSESWGDKVRQDERGSEAVRWTGAEAPNGRVVRTDSDEWNSHDGSNAEVCERTGDPAIRLEAMGCADTGRD
jgi:hypothetical protein